MKRTSLLGALVVLASTLTGCVIHPSHIDPLTGCRTGCSLEAVPDGPLDCCFYVHILKCPLFPWNWGQYIGCYGGLCDVPPCGGGGCGLGCGGYGGVGPAYPPMLTGDACCGGGFGSCDSGSCGVPYGGMGYPVPPMGGCADGSCGVPPMTPTYGAPASPQMPMQPDGPQPPMPMPGALGEPVPNPHTYAPPASLMAPTSFSAELPYVAPMSYVTPAGGMTAPRVASPYSAAPRMLPAMQAARPMPQMAPMTMQGPLPTAVAH